MSDELFEPPFNLSGEPLTSEIDAEGEARVRALAESEARKSQLTFDAHDCPKCGAHFSVCICDI